MITITPIFERALAAAKISPEAFAIEFNKIDANANVLEIYCNDYSCGDPLIHSIINEISDEELPDLLSILIQYGVDLESKNVLHETPLMAAASLLKKNTVDFLIKNNACLDNALFSALSV